MEAQAKIMRDTLMISNRAWLSPTRAEVTTGLEDEGGPVFTVYFQNVGRAPADDVRIGMVATAIPNDKPAKSIRDCPGQSIWERLQKLDRDATPEEQGKDPAAVALGKKGGKARADRMTAERRAEIAKKAAKSRWSKDA